MTATENKLEFTALTATDRQREPIQLHKDITSVLPQAHPYEENPVRVPPWRSLLGAPQTEQGPSVPSNTRQTADFN